MRSTIKSVMKINNPQYDSCINSRKNFVKLILHNWNILNDVCNLWNWKVFDKLRRFREINFHYEVSNSLANKVSFTVILNLIAKTMIALFGNKSFDFWIFMWEDVYFCTYFEQHLSKKHCFLVSIPSEIGLKTVHPFWMTFWSSIFPIFAIIEIIELIEIFEHFFKNNR